MFALIRRFVIIPACAALLLALGAYAQTPEPVVRPLRSTGPNAARVNIAILGDGYTAAQQEQFFANAQQKFEVIANDVSFAAARDLVNGVAIFTASNESGTDIAAENVARDTYFDSGFSGTVNARLLTIATAAGRSRAQTILRQHAPDYDVSIVLVNTTLYGGAGGALTTASIHASSDEILLHEIGHSFAKLTDEYVDAISAPSYAPGEFINATQKTARHEIPWRDFILDAMPVPSTGTNNDPNIIGAWEGAYYRATGFYRPNYDSKMRSLNRPWGPVNLRAFAAAVHRLNLNGATAAPSNLALRASAATASAGGTVSLTASADGVGPLTYQWSRDGKFIAGQTNATLTLPNLSSAHVGTYTVEVTNAAGAATSAAAGITASVAATGNGGTYQIQIGMQPVVRWTQGTTYVSEQTGAVVLTVSRGGSAAGGLTVGYATVAGTAAAQSDFAAQTGTRSWADGDVADKTVTIAISTDALAEGYESFSVALSNPSVGIIVGSPSAVITVGDPGARDPGFLANFINSTVNRVAPLPDGSILVAGSFATVQDAVGTSYSYGRIARLKPDGSLDPLFKPGAGADGGINALARQPDGKILIGGDFANYDGVPRARIARLNADGSLDASFNAGSGADRIVYDFLIQPDGRIVVAGAFTAINGAAREYLARLNADGSLDTSFNGPDFGNTTGWWVRSLAELPDGRMLAAGTFFFSGATTRASVCRLNANGSLDTSFNGIVQGTGGSVANTLGEVRQLTVLPDGSLLICGTFVSYNQAPRRGIARLTSTGALDASFDPGSGGDQPIDTFVVQPDGKVVIGGRFTSINGVTATRLARLHPDGSLDASFLPGGGPSGAVVTLAAQRDGNILVGSTVATFQGSSVSRPIWRLLSATVSTAAVNNPQTPTTNPTPSDVGRLINLSIRTDLASSSDSFTFGFVVGGAGTSGSKALLLRAAGPSLTVFGLSDVLADPKVELYRDNAKVAENDNWSGAESVRGMNVQVAAFPFAADTSRDAALALPNHPSGGASAIISGSGAGTVIAELYDATPGALFATTTPRLVNVSVRKHLGNGVIAGFVIGGSTRRTVLIRAIGPTLGGFGVDGVVSDPQLALFSGANQIAANDNWGGTPALQAAYTSVGAFALPNPSRDAALVAELQPGNYTVQVNGVGGTTGVALIEVYEVP